MFTVWVVYKYPLDFPDKWVVRRQVANPDSYILNCEAHFFENLFRARRWIRKNTSADYRLKRQPNDDPVVFECWI